MFYKLGCVLLAVVSFVLILFSVMGMINNPKEFQLIVYFALAGISFGVLTCIALLVAVLEELKKN